MGQARRYDKDANLDTLTDDYINSFKREVENLKQLLEKKDQQVLELLYKNEQLKAYASELKNDLQKKYSAEGKVMPRDLQEAPEALSPRKDEISLKKEMKKSKERRDEVLKTGLIEQLQAENDMLK